MTTPPFIVERIFLTEQEREQVRKTMATPGYAIMRDMIAARECESLAGFMDGSLYDTATAEHKVEVSRADAQRYAGAMEVLDQLANPEEEWFRIKLDQRR